MGAAEKGSDGGVLAHGQGAERPDGLEGTTNAKPGDPIGRLAGERTALPADVAPVQPVHAADAVEQRRLAGAVGSDDPDDLALPPRKAHSADRSASTESFGDIAKLELRGSIGDAHSDVSLSDRRRYARLSRLRPPK